MATLSSLPFFKGLPDREIEKIEAIAEEKSFEEEVILCREGDPSEKVYLIQSGTVRVVRGEGHDAIELAVLEAGDFFGEMGVLENAPRSATVTTCRATRVLAIAKADFMRLMATNPHISRRVLSTLSRRYSMGAAAREPKNLPAKVAPRGPQAPPQRPQAVPKARIIGLFSASGGVGTSFLAANLASALCELTDKRVLVIDLDLMFGDQAVFFDVKSKASIEDLCGESELDEAKVLGCVVKTEAGPDLLRSPIHPEEAESLDPALLLSAIEILRCRYDYIVCDTAQKVQELNLHLLELVQFPLYVLTPDLLGAKNAARWLSLMRKIDFPVERVRLLFNKCDEEDEAAAKLLQERLKLGTAGLVPYDRKGAQHSIENGELVTLTDPTGPLGRSIREVAGAVVGIELPASEEPFWARWIGL